MTPDEQRDFRPCSKEEIDREMDACFLRWRQQGADERASRVEPLRQDAMHAVSHEDHSQHGDDDASGEIPEDLTRMLNDLASSSPPTAVHDKVTAPNHAARSTEEATSAPARREPSDTGPTSAPADAGAETPAKAGATDLDRFPVASLYAVPEFDDPGRELAALCRELQNHRDYRAVRARYCQLSIRLNLHGKHAPAFRPRPRGGAYGDPAHMLVHRDQLVIDYHWCYTTRMPLSPTDARHAHVLDLQADFDFAAAWSLTSERHTRKFRAAEAMCLTPFQQCQTMRLHGQELEARMVAISGTYRKSAGKSNSDWARAKTAIGQWIERDPRMRKHQVSYERLWLSRELLGPGAAMQLIAELHGLMGGERPLSRKTIADKLDRLSKNVDATM